MKPFVFRGIAPAVQNDIGKVFPFFNAPNAPALFKHLRESCGSSFIIKFYSHLHSTAGNAATAGSSSITGEINKRS